MREFPFFRIGIFFKVSELFRAICSGEASAFTLTLLTQPKRTKARKIVCSISPGAGCYPRSIAFLPKR